MAVHGGTKLLAAAIRSGFATTKHECLVMKAGCDRLMVAVRSIISVQSMAAAPTLPPAVPQALCSHPAIAFGAASLEAALILHC